MSDAGAGPEEIAQTRAEMSGTLAALGDKLDPHALAGEAKDVASDTTQHAKEAALAAVDHAKEALPGIVSDATDHAKEAVTEVVSQAKEAVTEMVQQLRTALPEAAGNAARSAVSNAVDETKQAISKGLHTTGAALGGAAGSAQKALGGATGGAVTAARGASGSLLSAIDATAPDGAGVTLQGITMTLTDRIKSNPPAAVLAGLGLYLLFRGANKSAAPADQPGTPAGDKLSDAGTFQQKAGDLGHQVQDAAGSLGAQVQDKASQGGDALQHLLQDNPLAVGGIALGLGALVGLALPSTAPEQRLMGTASTALVQKAQDAVQDKVSDIGDKVQNIAGIAGDAVNTMKESVAKAS